jgi:triosephosphate isomerase
MTTPLIVGNWKMNGSLSQCFDLARKITEGLRERPSDADVVLAPPYTALTQVKQATESSNIKLGGQDCHWQDSGAFTGEISPPMLKDSGCEFVILGHSERRHIVRETLKQRRSGRTTTVIARQLRIALKDLVKTAIEKIEIAYEPVWAIGTGQTATPDQISQVHQRIRQFLKRSLGDREGSQVRILYGGSVNADNALSLIKTLDVSGLLVGGASLKAETFLPIVHRLSES